MAFIHAARLMLPLPFAPQLNPVPPINNSNLLPAKNLHALGRQSAIATCLVRDARDTSIGVTHGDKDRIVAGLC
jgi:hypothetical protein